MKKLLIFGVLLSIASHAQFKLSGQAKISVITCGPWQGELYSAFGHSAFRVHDPARQLDIAYNYGVFDFNQPHFYLNFARGYLYYKLGVYSYPDFEYFYISYNRYVHEQVLNLDSAQRQKMFDYLQWNARPENQNYRYDYFYNNCATKMRDVVLGVFGDQITFNSDHIKTDYTIRELTDLYILKTQPWGDLGIDICLGLPMDKTAAPLEYMFLPDYVERGFDNATIKRDGKVLPLVEVKNNVYESQPEKISTGIHPLIVFSILLVIAAFISYRDFKRNKLTKWFDTIFFIMLGLMGCLLLFLWVATDHKAAANNLNILWAIPTHLIAAVMIYKQPSWLRKYFMVTAILSIALLLVWFFLPQKMHYALIPIVMTAALRSWTQYKLAKK